MWPSRARLTALLATLFLALSLQVALPALAADSGPYRILGWYPTTCNLLPCIKYDRVPLRYGYYKPGDYLGRGESGFGRVKIEEKHDGELTWPQIEDTLFHPEQVKLDKNSSTKVVFRKRFTGRCGCPIPHSRTWWARVVVEYAPSRSAPDQAPLGILTAYHEV
ncbi:exported hypothetical protein [Frankia sp. AiPs1]